MADSSNQVALRYPVFDLWFFTEKDDFHITYSTKTGENGVDSNFMGESVTNLVTKNAMEDDSAVFSFSLSGDVYWDRILNANDAVVLRINPDENGEDPQNPVLLVGMISEVQLESNYSDNQKSYRIIGQNFAKALINFEIGVIQEVNVNLTDIGWLPDSDGDGGIMMSKTDASDFVHDILERFKDYIKYQFAGERGITDFLDWSNLDSWKDDESLSDPTPFINFEGSLKQLIDDAAAKPFNEVFFESTEDGKCEMIMRRTPFDEEDWNNLPTYTVTSDDVISESVSINDTEAYTVYNVSADNLLDLNSLDLGVFPRYFPQMVDRYGYKKLEVSNRYLGGDQGAGDNEDNDGEDPDEDNDDDGDDTDTETQSYGSVSTYADNMKQSTFDKVYDKAMGKLKDSSKLKIRLMKAQFTGMISSIDKRITITEAQKVVDTYLKDGKVTKENFAKITGINVKNAGDGSGGSKKKKSGGQKNKKPAYNDVRSHLNNNRTSDYEQLTNSLLKEFDVDKDQANAIAHEFIDEGELTKDRFDTLMESKDTEKENASSADSKKLKEFAERLANWYIENPNFYSGDITVKGSPDFRLGGRLIVKDKQNDETWEYYIESVQNEYSYKTGYTTTIGVTRGLQNNGELRFKNLWGRSEEFKGGYLGELSMEELIEKQKESSGDDGDDDGGGGSNGDGKGWFWPYRTDKLIVTSRQGMRGGRYHHGVDVVPPGQSGGGIYAMHSGKVEISADSVPGWEVSGVMICIRNDDDDGYGGKFVQYEEFAPGSRKVSVGDHVNGGQRIGTSGKSGNSTGEHLHFSINDKGLVRANASNWDTAAKFIGIPNSPGTYSLPDDISKPGGS